jgi:Ca2+-binding EF-hand superfamily protein
MIVAGLFVNVLLTVANRGDEEVSTSAWFLIFALLTFILSMFLGFFGELAGSTQIVWLAGQMGSSWVILSLIFSAAYHIIPMTSGIPIWSASMRQANLFLLFITLPPFFIASASASTLLLNLGAIVMTLGLLPIIAGSVNLLFTASGNTSAIVKNPGALAATLAMVLLPIYAIGAFFTGMDVFLGTGKLGDMATTLDMGFLWTVGGLMILSGAYISYPLACNKELSEPSKANLTVWFVLFGGFASTITNLIGDFTIQAVANSGVEDAVAQTEGFYLVGAALFYFTAIGAILATLVVIRTSASKLTSSHSQTSVSDINTYNLGDGVTTIRTLLGRGVGVDTKLVVGEMKEDEGGSTVIAVSAALHDDEVTEFPEQEHSESSLYKLGVAASESDMTIREIFEAMDADADGRIDGPELQKGIEEISGNMLTPMEVMELLKTFDEDSDGRLDPMELVRAIESLELDIASDKPAASSKVSAESSAEEPKASVEGAKELLMLANYLADSEQTIFQFFKSIDLDESGQIDAYEFQMALKNSKVANLPPWEMDSLIAAIDIDGDGQINLPELSIALANIRKTSPAKQSAPEVEIPSQAQLNKMKKAELVELATSLGLDASGTKKELVSLITEA